MSPQITSYERDVKPLDAGTLRREGTVIVRERSRRRFRSGRSGCWDTAAPRSAESRGATRKIY